MSRPACCSGDCNQGRDCPNRSAKGAAAWWVMPGLLLGLVLLLGVVGPTIDDHSLERAQADSLNDGIKAEQAKERFARAAAKMCGNGGYVEIGNGSIQCVTRIGGRKAITAKVTP